MKTMPDSVAVVVAEMREHVSTMDKAGFYEEDIERWANRLAALVPSGAAEALEGKHVPGVGDYDAEYMDGLEAQAGEIYTWLRERGLYDPRDYPDDEGPDVCDLLTRHEDELLRQIPEDKRTQLQRTADAIRAELPPAAGVSHGEAVENKIPEGMLYEHNLRMMRPGAEPSPFSPDGLRWQMMKHAYEVEIGNLKEQIELLTRAARQPEEPK